MFHLLYILKLKLNFLQQSMKRENPTGCNNEMFIINVCLNMFRASLCPSSGEQRPCYCIWCTALVLLDMVGSNAVTRSLFS